jgi:cytochrome c oxidase assembly factor CtaG
MRTATFLLTALSLACAAFAAWGLGTADGRRQFDEMAGILPLAAGVGAVLFAACALLTAWRHAARRGASSAAGTPGRPG